VLRACGTLFTLASLLSLSSCQGGCSTVSVLFYNYLPIQVGPTSWQFPIPNIPWVSVKICVPPAATNCQTIDNIMLDSGSAGLRVFSSVLTLNLPTEQSQGNPVAECAPFGSVIAWGSVASASVTLGVEPPVTVPIQVIDATYGTSPPPPPCGSPVSSPGQLGANGILGIMPTQFDGTHEYFTCQGGTCSYSSSLSSSSPGAHTVQNPVYLLTHDNNGVIVYLNPISDQGASQGVGAVVIGVATEPNNDPSFISSGDTYHCVNSSSAAFYTNYKGQQIWQSIADTGSNMLLFQDSSLPQCSITLFTTGYCPNPEANLTASLHGNTGTPQAVEFSVGNGSTLIASGNSALDDLAAPIQLDVSSVEFDWGLPFFFGRSVFIAYGSSTSTVCGSGGITANMWGFAGLPQTPSPDMQRILQKARDAQRQKKN
jgi:Protein of unknown function (DUF3443)